MTVVITNLIGGLGNQMFQYAAGRVLALRSEAELLLDVSGFANYSLRNYELETLSIAGRLADLPADVGSIAPSRSLRSRLGRWLGLESRSVVTGVPVYREPHFQFDPGFGSLAAPIHLVGYWQSERYFAEFADVLRRDFTPRIRADGENAVLLQRIAACDAVSLHVRRGDYVTDPTTGKYHGVCSIEYYERAVSYILERVPSAHFFVFSDDADWVRENLRFDAPTTYVSNNSGANGYRDMELMTCCKHHVIANSSFSWWGAWLNPSCDKIVVAPQQWFAVSSNDTRDLVPAKWVRI